MTAFGAEQTSATLRLNFRKAPVAVIHQAADRRHIDALQTFGITCDDANRYYRAKNRISFMI